ncbi:ABC transporter permease [Pedococcus sp. 5OH_020]|uniref:ABC transporter permease n=1 Tax=Pedococcus sp. 5OH_020 TaxID=2989814 RepID=UPI0022E9B4E1|nr:iron ABC transporter permease [Pedococcus sp. 5OH_020]
MTRPPRGASGATPAPVVAASLAVAALCVLPLLVVVLKAFEVGPAQAFDLLWRPRVGELLRNTASLVLVTVSLTTVLGVCAAWLVERTSLPGARYWRVLMVCPLAVPAFVNSYAWVTVRPDLEGLGGSVLVTTLSYFPFVFLPVAAVLRGLDQGLEDSARSLGLSPWAAFFRAVLPQLRPAALGGMLLVALHLLSEFGVLAMLRFNTFTTAILEQFQVAFSNSAGSLLAVVLIALCLALLTVESLLRGTLRHARLGRGAARRALSAPLGRWTVPALVFMTALTVLALGVPLGSLVYWFSAGGQSESGFDPAELAATVWGTLRLATSAGLVSVAAAFPVAWLIARRRSWLSVLVERATYVASSLPGVVIALALVTLSVRYARPVYQTSVVTVAAYTILFIPLAMVTIRAAMAHAPEELIEAARALGDGPLRAFLRVMVPLTAPGALAGFAMVFIATATELTATLLLAPTGTQTLATAFWSASESIDYAGAAPYAATMVLVSAPLTYLLLRRAEEEPTP